MRRAARVLGILLAAALGVAAGVAAIAVHRTWPGMLLGVGTALAVIWALQQWQPGAGTAFAAGWLVPVLIGVAGRPEGDYVFTSDLTGWVLVASGGVVLVAGLRAVRGPRTVDDSGSLGAST